MNPKAVAVLLLGFAMLALSPMPSLGQGQPPEPPVLLAPGEMPPPPPPPPSEWPDANSTGLYLSDGSTLRGQCASLCAGGVVSSGSINTSQPGTTIECLEVSGTVTIDEDDTTIRCVQIAQGSQLTGLWVRSGIWEEDGVFYVEQCGSQLTINGNKHYLTGESVDDAIRPQR